MEGLGGKEDQEWVNQRDSRCFRDQFREADRDGSDYVREKILRLELQGKRLGGKPMRRFMDGGKEDIKVVGVSEKHAEEFIDRDWWYFGPAPEKGLNILLKFLRLPFTFTLWTVFSYVVFTATVWAFNNGHARLKREKETHHFNIFKLFMVNANYQNPKRLFMKILTKFYQCNKNG